MKQPNASISSNTTTQDHFKDWQMRMPSRGYAEHPSYAGESLFPTKERNFKTSTNMVHQPIDVTKLEALQKADVKGTLVSEGELQIIGQIL